MALKSEVMRAVSGTSSKCYPTSGTASTCKSTIIILSSSRTRLMMTESSAIQNYLKFTRPWIVPIGQKGSSPWTNSLMKLTWYSLGSTMSSTLLRFSSEKHWDRVGTSGQQSRTRSQFTSLILSGWSYNSIRIFTKGRLIVYWTGSATWVASLTAYATSLISWWLQSHHTRWNPHSCIESSKCQTPITIVVTKSKQPGSDACHLGVAGKIMSLRRRKLDDSSTSSVSLPYKGCICLRWQQLWNHRSFFMLKRRVR